MTRQKHLKERVRARMSATGERYAVARSQVVGTNGGAANTAAPARGDDMGQIGGGRLHAAGQHPETSALRILLANAGVRAPGSVEPLSEALVMAIGGGVGMGVFQFQYPEFSSFYVAGRHLWQDSRAYLEAAVRRLGLEPRISETGGRVAAERNLFAALAAGPLIAWVDLAELGYRGLPTYWSGGGYHVLVVYEASESQRTALVGDEAMEPIQIPLDTLAAARARIVKQRHRLLSLDTGRADGRGVDLEAAIRDGLRACVEGLRAPRNRSFSLDALATWADRMDGARGTERWSVVFPRGRRLWMALRSIAEWIDYSAAGPGLLRPLFSDGLRESAALLGDPAIARVAERYEELGRTWSALADAALPQAIEPFRQARETLATLKATFREAGAGARAELAAGREMLDGMEASMDDDFPLDEAAATELLADLADRVRALHRSETAALAELAAVAATT